MTEFAADLICNVSVQMRPALPHENPDFQYYIQRSRSLVLAMLCISSHFNLNRKAQREVGTDRFPAQSHTPSLHWKRDYTTTLGDGKATLALFAQTRDHTSIPRCDAKEWYISWYTRRTTDRKQSVYPAMGQGTNTEDI
jgi:hypothetical protein